MKESPRSAVFRAMRLFLNQNWTWKQWFEVVKNVGRSIIFRISGKTPRPFLITENQLAIKPPEALVGVFIHIYYSEYIPRVDALVRSLANSGIDSTFHFTSPSPAIITKLGEVVEKAGLPIEKAFFKRTPNRGRNFGPLFTEFSEEFEKFEFIIHLHSKKSIQYSSKRADKWSMANWELLGLNSELLRRSLSILSEEESLGYCFSLDWLATPPHSFSWGLNSTIGESLAQKLEFGPTNKTFLFPAGGMFIAKSQILSQLKPLELNYGKFPIESGQLDGTLQHAIERLVGLSSTNLGLKGCFYLKAADRFACLDEEIRMRLDQ